MKVFQKLDYISKSLPSKIRTFLEITCPLVQRCQSTCALTTAIDDFPQRKQKRPRKYLSPILKQELDLKGAELRQFLQEGALETLDKYLLKQRLYNLIDMGFEKKDIKAELGILLLSSEEMMARKAILEECGVTNITTTLLCRFESFSRIRTGLVKASGYIPRELNVPEHILSSSGVNIPPPNLHLLRKARFLSATATADAVPLLDLHKFLVLHYMTYHLDDPDVFKSRRLYKPRSLRLVIEAFEALQALGVHKKQLSKCLHLSHCDTKKLDDLLRTYPKIGGEDLHKMIEKQPKIALRSASDVKAVLKCVQDNGFSEEAVAAYPAILTVNVNDLRQGLSMLKSLPDLWALRHSDPFFRLLCQKQLITKLQYFKSLPRKVVPTISLLTSANAAINRSLQRNSCRAHIGEFLKLLSVELNTDVCEVREILSRHPHWRLGSASEMFSTLSYLRLQGFTDKAILECVQILLYPRSYVKTVLEEEVLPSAGLADRTALSKTHLSLCLYYIEKQHGFTGLGVNEAPEPTRRGQTKFFDRCRGRLCRQDCVTNPLCSLKLGPSDGPSDRPSDRPFAEYLGHLV